MSQVTMCFDDEVMACANSPAAAAQRVEEQALQVDANGYPLGFFDDIAADAQRWQDFPQAEALRAKATPDLPREAW